MFFQNMYLERSQYDRSWSFPSQIPHFTSKNLRGTKTKKKERALPQTESPEFSSTLFHSLSYSLKNFTQTSDKFTNNLFTVSSKSQLNEIANRQLNTRWTGQGWTLSLCTNELASRLASWKQNNKITKKQTSAAPKHGLEVTQEMGKRFTLTSLFLVSLL